MSFRPSILRYNFIVFAIFSITFSPIASNGFSDFAAELYEVNHLRNKRTKLSEPFDIIFIWLQQCATSKPGNIIISPLSVATSLGLLSQAAEGRTFDELRDGLHLEDSDKDSIADQVDDLYGSVEQNFGDTTLSIANRIYIQQGRELNEEFKEVANSKFRSGIDSLNFTDTEQSADIINQFVDEKTQGKIQNFVKASSLNGNMALFLVNAIYFKGNWAKRFDKDRTREQDFYISRKETMRTDFMFTKKRFNYAKIREFNATALEMKYANSTLSFVIVLPNSRAGLPDLEEKLRDYGLISITQQMFRQKVDVAIPKFKINFEIKLNSVLKEVRLWVLFAFRNRQWHLKWILSIDFIPDLDGN